MDAGDLVPDEITNAMVADRLNQQDVETGFMLDGTLVMKHKQYS